MLWVDLQSTPVYFLTIDPGMYARLCSITYPDSFIALA